MNKIIIRYWIIDLLIGLVLYAAYTVTIMNKTETDTGFFADVLYLFNIVLNLGYSLLYLTAVVVCSFSVFFNFIKKVRHNAVLSWLSFSGAPILGVAIPVISLWVSTYGVSKNLLTELLILSIVYPCFTTILYLLFRRKYKKLISMANTDTVDGKIKQI
ncbi:hypothetical protein SAMN05421827_12099 [Pedobacter terrae]|uniref:Uncharacterized protein n=1 Tax=Pedobacter terrae TaxID=405671 RepID=A0A1G8B1R8_9SPHI|nr:hypothetical protein [Pedobacter terrae]SDH27137.1 hypothetical protein SAMN05421827_12099 [Pedobacter terrae]